MLAREERKVEQQGCWNTPLTPPPGDGVLRVPDIRHGDVIFKHMSLAAYQSHSLVLQALARLYNEQGYKSLFHLRLADTLAYNPERESLMMQYIDAKPPPVRGFSPSATVEAYNKGFLACCTLVKYALHTVVMDHGGEMLFLDIKPANILYQGSTQKGLPILCPIDFVVSEKEALVKMSRGELFFWK